MENEETKAKVQSEESKLEKENKEKKDDVKSTERVKEGKKNLNTKNTERKQGKKKTKNQTKAKNIVIGIICVFAVLFAAVFAYGIRNYMVIRSLQNEISQYADSTNYHIRNIRNEKDGTLLTVDYYKKDNREKIILNRRKSDNENSIITMYQNGGRVNTYAVFGNKKTATLARATTIPSIEIINTFENNSKFSTFISCLFAAIGEEDYNGTRVYAIKNYPSTAILNTEEDTTYVEKETGLLIKMEDSFGEFERTYEFDTVTDSEFLEPDLTGYEISSK